MRRPKAGDIVRLRGGGPDLTVYYTEEGETDDGRTTVDAVVVWFDADQVLRQERIDIVLLEKAA